MNQEATRTGRVPPHALDAERAVLAAVLLEGGVLDEIQSMLSPDHFYVPAHRLVYGAALQLSEKGRAVDAVAVAERLRDRGQLDEVGGTLFLAELVNEVPAVADVESLASTIVEKARVRGLITTCHDIAARGFGDYGDAQEFLDDAEQRIFSLSDGRVATTMQRVGELVSGVFDGIFRASNNPGGISGVTTGFAALDRQTTGLHPGELFIVAARPGMGKTSFVLNMATNMARPRYVAPSATNPVGGVQSGHAVVFFSLEMPREQLAARIAASEARVSMSAIRSGQLSQDDWDKLTDVADELRRLPVWLDDTPGLRLLDVRARVRRVKAAIERAREQGEEAPPGIGMVAIDYLQLMQGRRDAGSREQEISEISRGLKQLAKELEVPVLALSQLNRSVETRSSKDRVPQLSDLRESGAIEQDADAVLFIYRDDYYEKEASMRPGTADIIVAKQRNGPTGKVELRFDSSCTRFDNLERDDVLEGVGMETRFSGDIPRRERGGGPDSRASFDEDQGY